MEELGGGFGPEPATRGAIATWALTGMFAAANLAGCGGGSDKGDDKADMPSARYRATPIRITSSRSVGETHSVEGRFVGQTARVEGRLKGRVALDGKVLAVRQFDRPKVFGASESTGRVVAVDFEVRSRGRAVRYPANKLDLRVFGKGHVELKSAVNLDVCHTRLGVKAPPGGSAKICAAYQLPRGQTPATLEWNPVIPGNKAVWSLTEQSDRGP